MHRARHTTADCGSARQLRGAETASRQSRAASLQAPSRTRRASAGPPGPALAGGVLTGGLKGGRDSRSACGAFTLVEIVVVVAVIGLLVALIAVAGTRLANSQKVNTTRNTMRLVHLAIDQFATEDPLRIAYTPQRVGGTGAEPPFGPYPPYQVARRTLNPEYSVAWAVDPNPPVKAWKHTLWDRLWRDLGNFSGAPKNWVYVDDENPRDDIRALYAYLAVYTPGALGQIPDTVKKRLPDCPDPIREPEMVNPTGNGTLPGLPGAIDVLGIYDAWGVPLDYFLYVKLEFKVPPTGGTRTWVVTDRIPVLRSRGISPEEATLEDNAQRSPDPQRWIFSEKFPQPAVEADASGRLQSTSSGWARARAGSGVNEPDIWDNYGFVPAWDQRVVVP